MSESQKMSYEAGQAAGQTQEKTSNIIDRATSAAQSAKETIQEGGQQVMAKAKEATEAVKKATGMNK